jgi:hypothetical protein
MSTLQLYGLFGANVAGGTAGGGTPIDYLTDTIKFTLHNNTYVPAIDTDDFFNDATNELTTANGYTAGGIAIGTKTVVYTAGTNTNTFDMDDTTVTWTASGAGITFRYLVLWKDTGTPTTSPLIGYIDSTGSGNQTITAGNTLTVTTGATGLFTGVVA